MSSNGETKPKLQYSKGSTTLYMTTFCSAQELCLKFLDFDFFLKISKYLGWRNDLNQSCSTKKDLKLSRSNIFHLN